MLKPGKIARHHSCLNAMRLSEAPCWGAFTFEWRRRQIYVPAFLNNVARYKPDRFWDWLIKDTHEAYIPLTYSHIVDGERV